MQIILITAERRRTSKIYPQPSQTTSSHCRSLALQPKIRPKPFSTQPDFEGLTNDECVNEINPLKSVHRPQISMNYYSLIPSPISSFLKRHLRRGPCTEAGRTRLSPPCISLRHDPARITTVQKKKTTTPRPEHAIIYSTFLLPFHQFTQSISKCGVDEKSCSSIRSRHICYSAVQVGSLKHCPAHIWRSRVLLSLACSSPSMRTCHARRLQRGKIANITGINTDAYTIAMSTPTYPSPLHQPNHSELVLQPFQVPGPSISLCSPSSTFLHSRGTWAYGTIY